MGYNLHARCLTHRESAFVSRGREAQAIKLFSARHPSRACVVEWAVDNRYDAPAWVDEENDLYLPDDLLDGGDRSGT